MTGLFASGTTQLTIARNIGFRLGFGNVPPILADHDAQLDWVPSARVGIQCVRMAVGLTLMMDDRSLGELDGTLPGGDVRRGRLEEEERFYESQSLSRCVRAWKRGAGNSTCPLGWHCPAPWRGRRSCAQWRRSARQRCGSSRQTVGLESPCDPCGGSWTWLGRWALEMRREMGDED